MPLTESEELELLELEELEAMSGQANPTPTVPRETKQRYGQRVQADIEKAAGETIASQQKSGTGINRLLSTAAGAGKSMMAYPANVPGVKELAELAGKGFAKAMPGTAGAIGTALNFTEKRAPEEFKNLASIAGTASTLIPAAGVAAKVPAVASKAAGAAGRGIEQAGISALGGQMKIPKAIAQKGYGGRLDLKKQNILKNISKYNLESLTGNFSKMADNASMMATGRVGKADEILAGIAQSPAAPQGQFVDDIIMDAMDKLDDIAAVGKEGQAQAVIDNIIAGATNRGMAGTGPQGIDAIIDFKRKLDPDGNLFKTGPAVSEADNLDRSIRKELYHSAVNKIREISPEAADLNKQAKELIDISNAASDAASRTVNPNKIFSMSNMLVGGSGTMGAAALQSPEVLAGTGGVLLLKKLAEQGRGPALLMKTGKSLQGRNPVGNSGIADLLKNERGAVGGAAQQELSPQTIQAIADAAERHGGIQNIDMVGTRRSFSNSVQDGFLWYNTPDGSTHVVKIRPSQEVFKGQAGSVGGIGDAAEQFVGTTAIRDPATGKIYTGGFRGHRDAILKGETPEIQDRLKQEYFNDTFSIPTGHIGYIDKRGNFLSRSEVEKEISVPKSPAQMFHTVGLTAGTGAAAGAGLGIAGLLNRK